MITNLLSELMAAQSLPRGVEPEEEYTAAIVAKEDQAIKALTDCPARSLSELAEKLAAIEYTAAHVGSVVDPELLELIRSAASDARRLG
jgi:hypothetical protein